MKEHEQPKVGENKSTVNELIIIFDCDAIGPLGNKITNNSLTASVSVKCKTTLHTLIASITVLFPKSCTSVHFNQKLRKLPTYHRFRLDCSLLQT